jgi:hypothetical protein
MGCSFISVDENLKFILNENRIGRNYMKKGELYTVQN